MVNIKKFLVLGLLSTCCFSNAEAMTLEKEGPKNTTKKPGVEVVNLEELKKRAKNLIGDNDTQNIEERFKDLTGKTVQLKDPEDLKTRGEVKDDETKQMARFLQKEVEEGKESAYVMLNFKRISLFITVIDGLLAQDQLDETTKSQLRYLTMMAAVGLDRPMFTYTYFSNKKHSSQKGDLSRGIDAQYSLYAPHAKELMDILNNDKQSLKYVQSNVKAIVQFLKENSN